MNWIKGVDQCFMQLDINLFMGSHVRVVLQEGWFGSIYEEARTDCRKGGSEQSMRGLERIAGMWFGTIYEKASTGCRNVVRNNLWEGKYGLQEGLFWTIIEGARTDCRKGGSEQSIRGLGRVAGRVVWNNLWGG